MSFDDEVDHHVSSLAATYEPRDTIDGLDQVEVPAEQDIGPGLNFGAFTSNPRLRRSKRCTAITDPLKGLTVTQLVSP